MGEVIVIAVCAAGVALNVAVAVKIINRMEKENRQLRIGQKAYYLTTKLLAEKEGGKNDGTDKNGCDCIGLQKPECGKAAKIRKRG